MSTSTEDRLVAALRARAEQVQPSDLRPLERPVGEPRGRRPLVVGLVAVAAAVAVVAIPLARGGGTPARTPVPPAGSGTPRPTPGSGHTIDIDGDGGPDRVRLDYDEATARFTVRVDRFGGGTVRAYGVAAVRPELLSGFDLDGDTADEVAVRAVVDAGQLPDLFTYVADRGLVPVAFPDEQDAAGWSTDLDGRGWATKNGRLYSWAGPPGDAPDDVVDFWVWRLDGAAAVPSGPRTRCLPPGEELPGPC